MSVPVVPNALSLLDRSLEQCLAVISALCAEQADWPTPCSRWRVKDLLHHLVLQDLHHFTLLARGGTVEPAGTGTPVRADWTSRFSDGADQLARTWATADMGVQVALPGGGEAPLRSRLGLQIAEFTVHAWDLAVATDVPVRLDPVLAEQSLAWAQRTHKAVLRGPGCAFGIEVPVAGSAEPYARLAGWFGRDPAFRASPAALRGTSADVTGK